MRPLRFLLIKEFKQIFRNKVIAIYTLKDGKIAKGDITYDGLKLYQQLGFYPPMPEEK